MRVTEIEGKKERTKGKKEERRKWEERGFLFLSRVSPSITRPFSLSHQRENKGIDPPLTPQFYKIATIQFPGCSGHFLSRFRLFCSKSTNF